MSKKPTIRTSSTIHVSDEDALRFHSRGRPGKLEITPTKPLTTQRDLSLAYSPGVAAPCLRIAEDPACTHEYTAKGNMVAVISNGTAVLGLGNLGALAAKPVMEGKAVLFKRFADIDAIDLEIDTEDVDAFINCVRYLGPSFGGINLEDIKAPECFIIEQRLREIMDIPVFHDDQHGTAIITAAGFLNALDLTGRKLKTARVVVNGAGSAAIACIELIKALGLPHNNAVLCDSKGVIYQGREEGINQWKSAHAVDTDARTLAQAIKGADVFLGLSVKGALTPEMVKSMATKPIIFAMANPDPEIEPEKAKAARPDAIIATGRSDYPNQVNNVLGFPYIFRGALDVQASAINDEMKIAAVHALARLARENVPDEVFTAMSGGHLHYGPDYIIPSPFDPRLITAVPMAVAEAAMKSRVARRPITNMEAYRAELQARLDRTSATLHVIFEEVRRAGRRVIFAEGEEEKMIRAAAAFADAGYGTPILLGRENLITKTMKHMGMQNKNGIEITNAKLSRDTDKYLDFLYARLQRQGVLERDCRRMVNQERNVFAACMVALGDADAMISGLTRNFSTTYDEITRVIDLEPGKRALGLSLLLAHNHNIFIADSAVRGTPLPEELADIAEQTAEEARLFGHEPRVAFVSYSNFGNPSSQGTERLRQAVAILDQRKVDFEYDGEMSADVALDAELMRQAYPFCRLTGPANVLVMPNLNAANISSKLLLMLGGGHIIGPLLIGLSKPAQIALMNSSVSDIVNLAALAAYHAVR
jgi:malate dehydrogenase (oxaloacetate-decarboxylating)(NADP+)